MLGGSCTVPTVFPLGLLSAIGQANMCQMKRQNTPDRLFKSSTNKNACMTCVDKLKPKIFGPYGQNI